MLPALYVAAGLGTTAAHLPPGGPVDGPAGDVSPSVGVGAMVTEQLGLELDAALTVLPDGHTVASGGPAVVWAFHPNAYAAARVFLDTDLVVTVLPGIGLTRVFDNGLAPYVELDVSSTVGPGRPDLALLPGFGLSFSL